MVGISLAISGFLAIIVGILVLAFPKFLRIAIGLYLLIIGVLEIISSLA